MSKYGPEWVARKKERLEHDEHTCQDCGSEAWQVHHEEYAPEGETASLDMLVSLCPYCHGERHGRTYISPIEKPEPTVSKQITIREDQEKWIDDNYINLSSLVRGCIDERMESSSAD